MSASSPTDTSLPLVSPAVFRRLVIGAIVYIAVVSAFFLAFPQVDQAASGLFYDTGAGFWAASDPLFMRLRELGPFLVKLVAVAALGVLVASLDELATLDLSVNSFFGADEFGAPPPPPDTTPHPREELAAAHASGKPMRRRSVVH